MRNLVKILNISFLKTELNSPQNSKPKTQFLQFGFQKPTSAKTYLGGLETENRSFFANHTDQTKVVDCQAHTRIKR